MKRLFLLAALAIISLSARAQTGSTIITIVAAPALGTVTPTPANFYQNTAAPISFSSSTKGFNASCSATVGTVALPLTYNANTGGLTATLTAAMTSTIGNVTIAFNCIPTPLSMLSPITLPNASVGQAYSANLAALASLSGGIPPYKFSLASGALPPGLSLQSSGVISGVASSALSSNFTFTVSDSRGS